MMAQLAELFMNGICKVNGGKILQTQQEKQNIDSPEQPLLAVRASKHHHTLYYTCINSHIFVGACSLPIEDTGEVSLTIMLVTVALNSSPCMSSNFQIEKSPPILTFNLTKDSINFKQLMLALNAGYKAACYLA